MLKGLMTVAAAAVFAAVFAADSPMIRKLTLEAEMIAAPDVQYRSQNAFLPKLPSASKWLMFKIDYTPDVAKTFIPEYRLL